jgi:hypothetical protein
MLKFHNQEFEDERGLLQVLELGPEIPFEVKRIFTVSRVPAGRVRGEHAHKICQQYLWLVEGSLELEVLSSRGAEHLFLNSEKRGKYLPPLHWGKLSNFTANTILLVLASEIYSADDYIVDLQEFKRMVNIN